MGKSHWVTCVECGSRFDASKGGYYNRSTKRYTCKKCGKAIKKAENRNSEGKEWFKKYWKLLFGILCLIGGLGNFGKDIGAALFGTIIGLALLGWFFVPKYLEKKSNDEQMAHEKMEEEERVCICKRCGASSKGTNCEYCGSPLND